MNNSCSFSVKLLLQNSTSFILFFLFDPQVQGEFAADGVDLYDDVIAAAPGNNERGTSESSERADRADRETSNEETNGNASYHSLTNNIQPNQVGRRHQLYVGNLTWVILQPLTQYFQY